MKFTHRVETPFRPTFRSSAVAGMFDVSPGNVLFREWDVDFPIEDFPDWRIGLIVGPSGSGKTSLAKRIFGEDTYHKGFTWGETSVLDDFPDGLDTKVITKALSSVGFSSPPNWLQPFHTLSNGQQFRTEIARLLLEPNSDLVVLDEFTSVVDRQVAKFSCAAVERYVRSTQKKFVAVSCHDDIVPWLQPDWVYRVDTNTFSGGRSVRRPAIELEIQQVSYKAWDLFKYHHYLSRDIQATSHCYAAFLDGTPVGFNAIMRFPHKNVKNGYRSHRTVVLPDYQGLRIGVEMNDAIAMYYCRDLNQRFFGKSTHPAMNSHRRNSPNWMLREAASLGNHCVGPKGRWSGASIGRATESYEFVGHLPERQALIEAYNAQRRAA